MKESRWHLPAARPASRAAAQLPRYVAFFAALLLALVALSGSARAADTATAQALFDDAKKLMAAGKYADACPKLEESQSLAPGLGTQFNLALCYENLGKTASAWSLYLEVAGGARAANQLDREKVARQQAAALEGKLSRLTITVSDPPEGIEVKRDGKPVGRAQWGTAIPIDPGEYTLTATAPGKKAWESKITIDKPGTETVEVPALEDGGASEPEKATLPEDPKRPRMKRRSGGMFAGGIVAIGVGTLTTLGGVVMLAGCDGKGDGTGMTSGTDMTGGTDRNAFNDCTKGEAAAVTVVGALVLAGGIALTLHGGEMVPNNAAPKKASAVPVVTVGLGSASLRWEF